MKICDNGTIREMTPEEEAIAENLPDPTDMPVDDTELLGIIIGGTP